MQNKTILPSPKRIKKIEINDNFGVVTTRISKKKTISNKKNVIFYWKDPLNSQQRSVVLEHDSIVRDESTSNCLVFKEERGNYQVTVKAYKEAAA